MQVNVFQIKIYHWGEIIGQKKWALVKTTKQKQEKGNKVSFCSEIFFCSSHFLAGVLHRKIMKSLF